MTRKVRRRLPRGQVLQLTTQCSTRYARLMRWVTWEIALRWLAPTRAETTRRPRRPCRRSRAGLAMTSRDRSHDRSNARRDRIHDRGVEPLRMGIGYSRLRAVVAGSNGAVERCRARPNRAASK